MYVTLRTLTVIIGILTIILSLLSLELELFIILATYGSMEIQYIFLHCRVCVPALIDILFAVSLNSYAVHSPWLSFYTIVVCVPSFDFIKIYLYIVYIYESKKIRNDTKELLFRDKRKHIILNYKVRSKGGSEGHS